MKKKEVKKDLSLLMPNAEKKKQRAKQKEISDGLECRCINEGISACDLQLKLHCHSLLVRHLK